MAWTVSKLGVQTLIDIMANTTAMDINSDTHKAALFDNTITPSQTVAAASFAYGAGVWAGGGVSDSPSWPAVGRDLASITWTNATNVVTFDAADTVSADATTDLTNVYGTLVYDDTIAAPVADQAWCYNYFGGANSVVSGTFTIVWNVLGIFAYTL